MIPMANAAQDRLYPEQQNCRLPLGTKARIKTVSTQRNVHPSAWARNVILRALQSAERKSRRDDASRPAAGRDHASQSQHYQI